MDHHADGGAQQQLPAVTGGHTHHAREAKARLPGAAGIAIGPVLFVIAALGLIATLISSNIGSYGSAGIIDRIAADIPSQANLIRTRMQQCTMKLASQLAIQNVDAGLQSPNCTRVADCASDPSAQPGVTGDPTLVSAVTCNGVNLWQGLSYPEPSTGFAAWNYVSNDTGGHCIYTYPTMANPNRSASVIDGLTAAARKFATQTTCNNASTACASEAIYDPASASQKFILWISLPTTGSPPDPACLP